MLLKLASAYVMSMSLGGPKPAIGNGGLIFTRTAHGNVKMIFVVRHDEEIIE